MTFLSKVIKEKMLRDWSVSNLNYEPLSEKHPKEDQNVMPVFTADSFTPMFFNGNSGDKVNSGFAASSGSDGTAQIQQPSPEIPEGMICIEEDDLQRQLSDAYLRGTEEGRQVAERGLSNVFRAIRESADSLALLREKILKKSEGDLLKLACLVAKKIILQEIRQDPMILANIVAATVKFCSDHEKITIRLNPSDYQTVMANQQMLSDAVGDESRVSFSPDNSIMAGGCLVETPTGTVDARIDAQLEELFNRCMEESGIPYGGLSGTEIAEPRT